MKESNDKGFSFQRGGPGEDPRNYKITWNTGKKTYTYRSEGGQHHYSERPNPRPDVTEHRQPEPPRPSRPPVPPTPPAPPRQTPPKPVKTTGKKIRKKSVVPLACVAVMWLGRALTGGLDSMGGIIRCAVLSAVAFGILSLFFPDKMVDAPEETKKQGKTKKEPKEKKKRVPKPEQENEAKPEEIKPEATKTDAESELEEVLRQGETSIAEIRRLNDEIPDFKISAQLKQLEILTERIFAFVRQHPEDVREIRQFLNFYLPTTIKLLRQYVVLQNQGMRMGNIDEGMQKVEDMLDKVIVAFQKQLDSLFESDVVDITADIQVMEQMMAAEGLVGDRIEVDET